MHFRVEEKNDFARLYLAARHNPWKINRVQHALRIAMGISALLIASLIFIIAVLYRADDLLLNVAVVTFSGVCILLSRIFSIYRRRLAFKQAHGADVCTVYEFGDQITCTTGKVAATYDYKDFASITEDDVFFFLWMTDKSVHMIPKNGFVEGSAEEFKAFVAPRLSSELPKGSGKVMPYVVLVVEIAILLFFVWEAFLLIPDVVNFFLY